MNNAFPTNSAPCFAGADGCRAGWLALIGSSRAGWRIECFPDMPSLWHAAAGAHRFLLDVPIGLADSAQPTRGCDAIARKLLGRRHVCVFSPPSRAALYADSYSAACSSNFAEIGLKLSKQCWHIMPKIREVDAFLQSTPAARALIMESHPEVCWLRLNNGQPLLGKKSPDGLARRLALLRTHFPAIHAPVAALLRNRLPRDVKTDDLLDAAVLAGRAESGDILTLADPPNALDSTGLPVRIVY